MHDTRPDTRPDTRVYLPPWLARWVTVRADVTARGRRVNVQRAGAASWDYVLLSVASYAAEPGVGVRLAAGGIAGEVVPPDCLPVTLDVMCGSRTATGTVALPVPRGVQARWRAWAEQRAAETRHGVSAFYPLDGMERVTSVEVLRCGSDVSATVKVWAVFDRDYKQRWDWPWQNLGWNADTSLYRLLFGKRSSTTDMPEATVSVTFQFGDSGRPESQHTVDVAGVRTVFRPRRLRVLADRMGLTAPRWSYRLENIKPPVKVGRRLVYSHMDATTPYPRDPLDVVAEFQASVLRERQAEEAP